MKTNLLEGGTLLQKSKSTEVLAVQFCCSQTVGLLGEMSQTLHQLPCEQLVKVKKR